MGWLVEASLDALRNFARFAWVVPVLVSVELAFPKDRVTWTSRMRGFAFWSLTIPFAAVVATGFAVLRESIGLKPLIDLRVSGWFPAWLGIIAAPYLVSLINDFFIYWYHRAQHVWLWRFHGVHHAIEELSAANSYDHITEEIWMTLLKSAPMGILIAAHNDTYWLIGALISMQGFWVHCNTRLSFGPLRLVLADNRYHRIHHSIEERHWNKNFAIFSPFWDVVFGTAHFPKRGEWPATGTPEQPEPTGLVEWLFRPLTSSGRLQSAGDTPSP